MYKHKSIIIFILLLGFIALGWWAYTYSKDNPAEITPANFGV